MFGHPIGDPAQLETGQRGAISVELTPDDLREIDTAASKITVRGARSPGQVEKMTGL